MHTIKLQIGSLWLLSFRKKNSLLSNKYGPLLGIMYCKLMYMSIFQALVGKSDGVPDIYWYSLPVVSDLIDQSSSSSDEDKLVEAENLLIKTISSITEEYKNFYNGKVMNGLWAMFLSYIYITFTI